MIRLCPSRLFRKELVNLLLGMNEGHLDSFSFFQLALLFSFLEIYVLVGFDSLLLLLSPFEFGSLLIDGLLRS